MENKIVKPENIEQVAGALSAGTRVKILQLLMGSPYNVTEIAEQLNMPVSSAISAVIKLEEAGLITTYTQGKKKICMVPYQNVLLQLTENDRFRSELDDTVFYSIPVGDYSDFLAIPSCGLLGDRSFIGPLDESEAFLSPNRVFARLVWLRKGFLQYRFSRPNIEGKRIQGLSISLELCSEFPGYNNDFPSEIVFSINNVDVGTWIAPGDYGGRYGLFTPKWWGLNNTQFGDLVTCAVTEDGTFFNSKKASDVTISSLGLDTCGDYITFKVGTNSTGGFNLFGKGFGDYNQEIVVRINLADSSDAAHPGEDAMPALPNNTRNYAEYIAASIKRNLSE